MGDTRTIIKRDHLGAFVWQYEGEVVTQGAYFVCIQARFNRDKADIGVMVFRRGDVMTEWFYDDRWYNIFKVQDDTGERLKGYYCNITRPAEITDTTIAADDLALDVFVSPKGEITLLDEDDFAALPLSDDERQSALDAIEQIRALVSKRETPFDFE